MVPLNCTSSPCKNNGTCFNVKKNNSNSLIGYECKCNNGFSGSECETSIFLELISSKSGLN